MPKALTISGMVVAVLLFLIFTIDLSVGFPFRGASKWMDIGMIICSLALAYMSWSTLRDFR
jgi:hypothetical protein